jgi:hypothetical protein
MDQGCRAMLGSGAGLVGGVGLRQGGGHAIYRPARSLHPGRGGSVGGSRRESCLHLVPGRKHLGPAAGLLGQAASGPARVFLDLGLDVGDQRLAQLALAELVLEACEGKPHHIAGRDRQIIELCLSGDAAKPLPLLSGQVDGAALVCLAAGGWHAPSQPTLRCLRESKRRGVGMAASVLSGCSVSK